MKKKLRRMVRSHNMAAAVGNEIRMRRDRMFSRECGRLRRHGDYHEKCKYLVEDTPPGYWKDNPMCKYSPGHGCTNPYNPGRKLEDVVLEDL